MAYVLKVVRFGLHPENEPSCYAVGFSATAENGRGLYRDTIVNIDDAKGLSEEEIINLAWIKLGPGIEKDIEILGAKSVLVGQVFEPSETAKAAVATAIEK
jgi:hypothetical protein